MLQYEVPKDSSIGTPRLVDWAEVTTLEDLSKYISLNRLVEWLDVDPRFDINWLNWVSARPFAYCPGLGSLIQSLGKIDFNRAVVKADPVVEAVRSTKNYDGIVKNENLTSEQFKFALGISKTENGKLRPVRLDKAILSIYAVNSMLLEKGKDAARQKIILSAFNIQGIAAAFNKASSERKVEIRKILSEKCRQDDYFVGDFLKGRKASLKFSAIAYDALIGEKDFAEILPNRFEDAIETPSHKFTQAAHGENFSAINGSVTLDEFLNSRKSTENI